MFELIDGAGDTIYKGDDWIDALTIYHLMADWQVHVVLWEDQEPVREFCPDAENES